MIHPVFVSLSSRSAVRHLLSLGRSSSDKSSMKRSASMRLALPLLALTLGLGAWSSAERSMARSAPFELAQATPSDGVLQLNDSGDAVADLQRQLSQLGFFSDEITGFFGTATQAAVIEFQQSQGLTADGVVGAGTQAALNQGSSTSESASNAPRDVLQLNDSGEQVAELQRRLTALGYYSGPASGTFDGSTQFAVINFQQANGLVADGMVGTETTAALRRASGLSGQSGVPAASAAPVAPATSSATPTASTAAGGLLRRGSSGAAVSTLQTQLQSLGFYTGTITGVFDAQTEAAVIAFQQSRGLVADGIAGPQVNAALGGAAGSPVAGSAAAGTPGTQGSGTQASSPAQIQYIQQMQQSQIAAEQARREAEQARLEAEQARLVYQQNLQEGRYSTVELQRRLQSNGFNPGDVNGLMTPTTESAVSEAQRKYGLSEGDFQGTSGMPLF